MIDNLKNVLIKNNFKLLDLKELMIEECPFPNIHGYIEGLDGITYEINLDENKVSFDYSYGNIPYTLRLIDSLLGGLFTDSDDTLLRIGDRIISVPNDLKPGSEDFFQFFFEHIEPYSNCTLCLKQKPLDWAYSVTFVISPNHHDYYYFDLFNAKNLKKK